MKKRIWRYIICTLVIALSFTTSGCANKKAENGKGKYVEKDIVLPKECQEGNQAGVITAYKDSDGKLAIGVVDDTEMLKVFTLGQNDEWEKKTEILWGQQEDGETISSINLDDQGIYYLYCNDEEEIFVAEIDNDGTENQIPLFDQEGAWKVKPNSYYVVKRCESGDYIIQSAWNGPVQSFDSKTGEIKNTFSTAALSFELNKDQVIINDGWDNPIVITYDAKTGNQVSNIGYDIASDYNIISSNNQGIYLVNKSGILFNGKADTTWEKIIEPDGTRLMDAETQISQVIAMDDGSIISCFWGTYGLQLAKYYFDPEARNTYEKEVTIYMAYDQDVIKSAVSLYYKAHPEVKVNIQTWSNEMSPNENIEKLNTELLSGTGPDMIVLDMLPANTYIEKGLLLDISDVADEYIDKQQGYTNIVNSYKHGEGIYAIPLRFRVPMLWGKSEVIDNGASIEALAAYKETHPEQVVMNKNASDLAMQLYDISEPYLNDGDNKYNRQKLIDYINTLSSIGESDNKEANGEEFTVERIDFEMQKYEEIMDVVEGKSAVCIIEPRNFFDIARCDAILDATKGSKVAPLELNGQVIYHTVGDLAINANSKNADIIKDIIRIALSDDIQKQGSWMGFATSASGNALQEKDYDENSSGGFNEEVRDAQNRSMMVDGNIDNSVNICKQSLEKASLCGNKVSDLPYMGQMIAYKVCNGENELEELLDEAEQEIQIKAGN